MTNGRFKTATPRAADLRSVMPFLRDLEALCRRRGFILKGYDIGVVICDLKQQDLPGYYEPVAMLPPRHRARRMATPVTWKPGRRKG